MPVNDLTDFPVMGKLHFEYHSSYARSASSAAWGPRDRSCRLKNSKIWDYRWLINACPIWNGSLRFKYSKKQQKSEKSLGRRRCVFWTKISPRLWRRVRSNFSRRSRLWIVQRILKNFCYSLCASKNWLSLLPWQFWLNRQHISSQRYFGLLLYELQATSLGCKFCGRCRPTRQWTHGALRLPDSHFRLCGKDLHLLYKLRHQP